MKTFPYPAPRDANHFLTVRRWLGRNALRHLHQDYWKRGLALPSADELTGWLWDIARPAMAHLSHEKLGRAIEEATSWALTEYDPNAAIYERKRRAGAKGGRAGKIQLTAEDLLSVRDLSHAEAAKRLHVSRSTIQRARRDFDPTDAELGILIPSTGEVIEIPETSEGNDLVTIPDTVPRSWLDDFDADKARAAEEAERLAKAEAENPSWLFEGVEL